MKCSRVALTLLLAVLGGFLIALSPADGRRGEAADFSPAPRCYLDPWAEAGYERGPYAWETDQWGDQGGASSDAVPNSFYQQTAQTEQATAQTEPDEQFDEEEFYYYKYGYHYVDPEEQVGANADADELAENELAENDADEHYEAAYGYDADYEYYDYYDDEYAYSGDEYAYADDQTYSYQYGDEAESSEADATDSSDTSDGGAYEEAYLEDDYDYNYEDEYADGYGYEDEYGYEEAYDEYEADYGYEDEYGYEEAYDEYEADYGYEDEYGYEEAYGEYEADYGYEDEYGYEEAYDEYEADYGYEGEYDYEDEYDYGYDDASYYDDGIYTFEGEESSTASDETAAVEGQADAQAEEVYDYEAYEYGEPYASDEAAYGDDQWQDAEGEDGYDYGEFTYGQGEAGEVDQENAAATDTASADDADDAENADDQSSENDYSYEYVYPEARYGYDSDGYDRWYGYGETYDDPAADGYADEYEAAAIEDESYREESGSESNEQNEPSETGEAFESEADYPYYDEYGYQYYDEYGYEYYDEYDGAYDADDQADASRGQEADKGHAGEDLDELALEQASEGTAMVGSEEVFIDYENPRYWKTGAHVERYEWCGPAAETASDEETSSEIGGETAGTEQVDAYGYEYEDPYEAYLDEYYGEAPSPETADAVEENLDDGSSASAEYENYHDYPAHDEEYAEYDAYMEAYDYPYDYGYEYEGGDEADTAEASGAEQAAPAGEDTEEPYRYEYSDPYDYYGEVFDYDEADQLEDGADSGSSDECSDETYYDDECFDYEYADPYQCYRETFEYEADESSEEPSNTLQETRAENNEPYVDDGYCDWVPHEDDSDWYGPSYDRSGLEELADDPTELLTNSDEDLLRLLERLCEEPSGVRRASLNDYLESLGTEAIDFATRFEDTTGIEVLGLADDIPGTAALLASYRLVEQGEISTDAGVDLLRRSLEHLSQSWISGVARITADAFQEDAQAGFSAQPEPVRSSALGEPMVNAVLTVASDSLDRLGGAICSLSRGLKRLR